MIGLLLKDFYTLKQYTRSILIMLVFFALISVGMDNSTSFFQGMFVMLFMTMTISSFSYDNLAKWDRYALSLPVTKSTVVASKYLLAIIMSMFGSAIAFLATSIMLIFRPVEGFGIREHLLVTYGVIMVAIFFASILLPLIYKFGVEKSRLFLIAIFAVPFSLVVLLDKLGIALPPKETLITLFKLMPVLILLIFFVSYLLSVGIYKNKEI
jgi:ABC-2 type transport system permease protein